MSVRPTQTLHPAAWIVWATCAGFVAFVTTDPVYLVLLVAVSWFVHASNRATTASDRSFRVFLIAGLVALVLRTSLAFLGAVVPSIGAVTSATIAFAFLEGLRLATILVVFGTFNAVTDPFGLVRMAPRRFHEPALAAALALSIAPRTIASVGDVREAQRLRGLPVSGLRSLPSLAVPVLERGMEEASTLAESMDARGHGRGRRSRYRPQRWSVAAVAVAATAVGRGRDVPVGLDRRLGRTASGDGADRLAAGRSAAARRDRPARDPGVAPDGRRAVTADAIRYDGVSFTYPDAERPALTDVDVALPEGTFALAAGPTGAGKSTFLRAANGLVPHFTGGRFSGRVTTGGRDTLEHAPRALADVVAFVPQDPGGLLRRRPGGGRARLRHGEPRGRRGAHAPPRGGDAGSAGSRGAPGPLRPDDLRRRAATRGDRRRARHRAAHPDPGRADVAARPAGGRGRHGRAPTSRARPRHDGRPRRASARARGRLGGPRARVRSRPRARRRSERRPPRARASVHPSLASAG